MATSPTATSPTDHGLKAFVNPTSAPRNDDATRRQRARRTALWMAVIAALVYAGFIMLGVLNQ